MPETVVSTQQFRLRIGLLAGILTAAALLIYGQIHSFGFINYDDPRFITSNIHVMGGVNPISLRWAFTNTLETYWVPFAWILHMLVVSFFGKSGGAHHLVSLGFHWLNAWLCFWILYKLTRSFWRSFCVSLLFFVHPIQVEAVLWATVLRDVASSFLALLSFYGFICWRQGRGKGFFALSLASYALSLLTKPFAVVLPALFMLIDIAYPIKSSKKSLFLSYFPFFMVICAVAVVNINIKVGHDGVFSSITMWPVGQRIQDALVLFMKSGARMLWPDDLALLYPRQYVRPLGQVLLGGTLLAGVSVAAVVLRKHFPWFCFGWFWFLLTLALPIGVVNAIEMADRYCYLPLLGLLVLIVWMTAGVLERTALGRKAAGVLFIAAVLVLSVLSWRQAGYWKDDVTLFNYILDATESNFVAHSQLGVAYAAKGQKELALREFGAAVSIPKSADPRAEDKIALNNLGYMMEQNGYEAEAERVYLEILRAFPAYLTPAMNLARLYRRQGNYEKAGKLLDAYLKSFPQEKEVLYEQAAFHITLCDLDKAEMFTNRLMQKNVGFYEQALQLRELIADMRRMTDSERAAGCPLAEPVSV